MRTLEHRVGGAARLPKAPASLRAPRAGAYPRSVATKDGSARGLGGTKDIPSIASVPPAGDAFRSGEMEVPTSQYRRVPADASWLQRMNDSRAPSLFSPSAGWTLDSWQLRPNSQPFNYEDKGELAEVLSELSARPPLVTSWEIERLRTLVKEAQEGKRFLLQGGDCAEMLDQCEPDAITNKLKILLQMSLVLSQAAGIPVIRIGRLAGQYAKPRSKPTETVNGVTLPSYFGDLVNGHQATPAARRFDPRRLLRGYEHAASTLNFIRSLVAGGFADLHHPEYWDLAFFREGVDLTPELRTQYEQLTSDLGRAIRFMEALGEQRVENLSRVEFFTSHEALHLHYEAAQARTVPRRNGHYLLSTHFPWIGERTRQLDGAHIEFFRGIRNPVGIKVGPSTTSENLRALIDALNPDNAPGRIVLVSRMGATKVQSVLPALAASVLEQGRRVLWVCDPMHGNTRTTTSGVKTRDFDHILREVELSFDAHESVGSRLGGVHFELTGENVTECTGPGVDEAMLDRRYQSSCDPRLNYRQALEMAFRIAARLSAAHAPSSQR